MNPFLPRLLSLLIAAASTLSAAQFEGSVTFKVKPPKGQAHDLNYSIKGDKMRMDVPGPGGERMGVIMDTTKREATMIMDSQRMYMVNALPAIPTNAPGEKTGESPTLEKTGQTEKILGYLAEKFVSTYQGQKTELWLAEGLGTFMSMAGGSPMGGGRGGAPAAPAWERALAGKALFPLRVVSRDRDGAEMRMEVTAINPTTLPANLFEPPAGYQKFDMGNMMKGMMPGGMLPPGNR